MWNECTSNSNELTRPRANYDDAARRSVNCNETHERITTNPHDSRGMASIRCDSWRLATILSIFKTFVTPPRTLTISATGKDFMPNQNETQRTTTSSAILPRIPIRCGSLQKSKKCDLGLTHFSFLMNSTFLTWLKITVPQANMKSFLKIPDTSWVAGVAVTQKDWYGVVHHAAAVTAAVTYLTHEFSLCI